MALNKDQLGQVDERNLARAPGTRYVGSPMAGAVEALGGIGMRLHQGKVVRNLEQNVEAELEATTRLQNMSQEGYEDPSELFTDLSDKGKDALTGTLAQLEAESIAVEDVMQQRPALVGIARARLGKLVDETLARYPGYEREIMSRVSNLGFNPRGWAAQRILGLDGVQAASKAGDIKWDIAKDRMMTLQKYAIIDPSEITEGTTADEIIRMTNRYNQPIMALENSILNSKMIDSDGKIAAFHGDKVIANATDVLSIRAHDLARNVLLKLTTADANSMTDQQLAAAAQKALVDLEGMGNNYRAAALGMINKMPNGEAIVAHIPEESLTKGLEAFKKNLEGYKALIQDQDYLKALRGNQEIGFLLKQNMLFDRVPSIYNTAALLAIPSVQIAVEKTGYGADLMNTQIELTKPYLLEGLTPNTAYAFALAEANNVFSTVNSGGKDAAKQYLDGLDKDEAKLAVNSVEISVNAGLESIRNGKQQNPDQAVGLMLDSVLLTNKVDGAKVQRPIQNRVEIVRQFTAPEVYGKLSPGMQVRVATAHAEVVAQAKQEVEDKYVIPLKDKAPEVAWVNGAVANPGEDGHYPDSLTFSVLTDGMAKPALVAVTDENAVLAAEAWNRGQTAMKVALSQPDKLARGKMLLNQWNQYAQAKANMYNTYVLPLVAEEMKIRRGYK